MMTSLRLFAGLVASLVVLAGGPGPALADRPPPVRPVPPDPNCLPAELSAYSVARSDSLVTFTMSGTVRACSHVSVGAFWTVATFRTGGPGVAFGPRSYLSQAGTTVTFSFETGDSRLDTWAACVVKNVRPSAQQPELMRADPVACIGSGEVGGVPAAVRIPNDDPRFTGALLTWLRTSDRPFCGSCV